MGRLRRGQPYPYQRDNGFVAGQAALKAESSKVAKHEKSCLENQHVFILFAFDTFGFLAPEAEEFLNRVQRVVQSNFSTPKTQNFIFSRIGFAIQKEVASQLVARLPAILFREKTEYLRCDFGNVEIAHNEEVDIRIGDKILQPKESFRYLGSMLHKSRRIDEELSAVIKAAWIEVGAITGECWPITKALANRVEVAELRMLRWTCGRTLSDMIPNGVYRAELEVENIINKMREGRLRWFRHVRRIPQSAPVRRVEALVVDGLRRRGRQKLRWEDRVKQDLKELRLSVDMTSDRNDWRARIRLCG
ncbi:hypothetical protein Tco_1556936 [Tanacetum coccineum]